MIIIAESGATKTDWCAIFADGSVRRLRSEGINFTVMSSGSIGEITQKAVAALNSTGELVSEMHFYAAGMMKERNSGDVEYASDLLGAARAVCGHNPGIAAILGTGSNSCFFDGKRIVKNIRSGGFILGDEGSAASLGRTFLSDFLKELVPAPMAEAFAASFKSDYVSIVDNVYKSETPSKYLGSLAPFILGWYGKCEYATEMVDDNFRRFFSRCLCQYDTQTYPVGIVGSFADACRDIILKIAEEYGVRISSITASPMDGLIAYHK